MSGADSYVFCNRYGGRSHRRRRRCRFQVGHNRVRIKMKIMEIRQGLEDRRRGIERRLAAIESDLSKQLDADSADRAIETENDEVLMGMERNGREELKAISSALDRIESGTYGRCVLCGAEIGERRLEAVPFTPYCVECARGASQ